MKSKEETNKERTHIKFFLKTIITLLAFVTSATYTIIFCEFFFGKNNVYAEETMANQDKIIKNQKKVIHKDSAKKLVELIKEQEKNMA